MRTLLIAGLLATATATPAAAQQQKGPVVPSAGSHSPVPSPTFDVPRDLTYRVAWDILTGSAKPAEPNAAYDVPARFLNQAGVVGVPLANVHVAVVIHGTAGEDLLSNAEFKVRKGVDNPNIAALTEMSRAGVRIILCGQTMASRKIQREHLLPFVQVAPSATWALAVLQLQGFNINPF